MRTVHFMARLWPMLLILLSSPVMAQDDVAELTAMLEHFLANADSRDVHEDFWADDLVYSSSSGLRFGKADIMQGFDSADAGDDEVLEPGSHRMMLGDHALCHTYNEQADHGQRCGDCQSDAGAVHNGEWNNRRQ